MLEKLSSKLSPGTGPSKAAVHGIHFASILTESSKLVPNEVFTRMKTSAAGLTEAEAAKRLEEVGPNVVVSEKHGGWLWRLLTAARNPLVVLLVVLASVSFATGDALNLDAALKPLVPGCATRRASRSPRSAPPWAPR